MALSEMKRLEMVKSYPPLVDKNKGIALLENKYKLSADDALRTYYEIQNTEANHWIAPWPNYIDTKRNCQKQSKDRFICTHRLNNQVIPFLVDLENKTAFFNTQSGKVTPDTLIIKNETGYEIIELGKEVKFSLAMINNNSQSIILDPRLATSTFNKLFFHNGHGMKCFELFDKRTQITGGEIMVWKVDWSCQQNSSKV